MNSEPKYLKNLQTRNGVGEVLKFSFGERLFAYKFFTDHGHKRTSHINTCERCIYFRNEYYKCLLLSDIKNVINIVKPISSERLDIANYRSIYPGLVFPFFNYSFDKIYKSDTFMFSNDLKFRILFKNLLKTLGAIHRHGIIHSDIKPLNILFNNFCDVETKFVIIDFGNSIFKKEMIVKKDEPLTTSGYITPEMILKKEFDETIDVYALAITMINIYTHKPVFKGFEKRTKKTKRIELHERMNYEKIINNLEIEDQLLVDLLINMLKYERKKRFTVKQCLQHRFFKKRKSPKKKNVMRTLPLFPNKKTGKKRKRNEEQAPSKKQKTTL